MSIDDDVVVDRAEVAEDFAELVDLLVLLRDEVEQVGIEARGAIAPTTARTASTSGGDEDLFAASQAEARERVEDSVGQLDSRGYAVIAIASESRGMTTCAVERVKLHSRSCCCCAVPARRREPLTAAKARADPAALSRSAAEPIYAEVPQKVWWNARFPKDDFDERSLRTFDNLQNAGLITVTGGPTADGAAYIAHVTQKGFPILGTAPSARGPVFRGTDLLQGLRRPAQLPAPSDRADDRPRRAGLALRRADAALSAVRDEDEQAARTSRSCRWCRSITRTTSGAST